MLSACSPPSRALRHCGCSPARSRTQSRSSASAIPSSGGEPAGGRTNGGAGLAKNLRAPESSPSAAGGERDHRKALGAFRLSRRLFRHAWPSCGGEGTGRTVARAHLAEAAQRHRRAPFVVVGRRNWAVLPGNVISACRPLRADRCPGAELTGHYGRAAKHQLGTR